MGLKLFPRKTGAGMAEQDEGQRARFGAYFPRVFAYVQHRVGDEATTRELVTESFVRVFSRPEDLREDEFRLALFGTARDLLDGVRVPPVAEGLTDRERDLVSLMFDGLLSRAEVATLLDVREETVTAELVRALKKLQSSRRNAAAVPSFLRAS
jgi:DNA-directed RNA polymerase specialized sigma24 family protein